MTDRNGRDSTSYSWGKHYDPTLEKYLDEVRRIPRATPDQQDKLMLLAKRGDARARLMLIKVNLSLVVSIAKASDTHILPLPDLINEGNIGLVDAIDKFDPVRKGATFKSYASVRIHGSIYDAIRRYGRTVRIARKVVEDMKMVQNGHPHPTEDGRLQDHEFANQLGISLERLNLIREARQPYLQLDEPIYNQDETVLRHETIVDENAIDPSKHADIAIKCAAISHSFRHLSREEYSVICMHFGLNGHGQHSNEEIGQILSVTGSRICQIKKSALAKLRKALIRTGIQDEI